MRQSSVFFSALALAAAGAASAATPLASASASLTNIQIELVDLDLNDGITPYIVYGGWGWGAAQADVGSTIQGSFLGMDFQPAGFQGFPIEQAQAQVSGSGYQVQAYRGESELRASASISGGSLNTNAYAWFASQFESSWDSQTEVGTRTGLFLLSPNTELRFSADYAISTSLSFADVVDRAWALADVRLLGSLGQTVVPDDGDWPFVQRATLQILNGQTWGVGEPGGSLSLVLANTTLSDQSLWLEAEASVNLTTPAVAAVPEPEQFALLLAGLGLIACVAGRRKASAQV